MFHHRAVRALFREHQLSGEQNDGDHDRPHQDLNDIHIEIHAEPDLPVVTHVNLHGIYSYNAILTGGSQWGIGSLEIRPDRRVRPANDVGDCEALAQCFSSAFTTRRLLVTPRFQLHVGAMQKQMTCPRVDAVSRRTAICNPHPLPRCGDQPYVWVV